MASCSAIAGFIVIALRVDPATRLPPLQHGVMIEETDAIWRPYGVAIAEDAPALDSCLDAAVHLTIEIARPEEGSTPRRGARRLGAIVFDRNLHPATTLMLDIAGVLEMISTLRLSGRPIDQWPSSIRERAAGRALGRVLAHEIGHYLLASPQHAASGLMRQTFPADELAALDRRAFAIAPLYLKRLSANLSQLTQSPSAAGSVP